MLLIHRVPIGAQPNKVTPGPRLSNAADAWSALDFCLFEPCGTNDSEVKQVFLQCVRWNTDGPAQARCNGILSGSGSIRARNSGHAIPSTSTKEFTHEQHHLPGWRRRHHSRGLVFFWLAIAACRSHRIDTQASDKRLCRGQYLRWFASAHTPRLCLLRVSACQPSHDHLVSASVAAPVAAS